MEEKVSKIEMLDFIRRRQVVTVHDLTDTFGYSYWGSTNKIRRLCRDRLVKRLTRGEFCLTDDGYLRLAYFKKI